MCAGELEDRLMKWMAQVQMRRLWENLDFAGLRLLAYPQICLLSEYGRHTDLSDLWILNLCGCPGATPMQGLNNTTGIGIVLTQVICALWNPSCGMKCAHRNNWATGLALFGLLHRGYSLSPAPTCPWDVRPFSDPFSFPAYGPS